MGLAELDPDSLAAVLDQVSAGMDFPMVLVGSSVACAGAIDAAITAAAIGAAG